MSRIEIYNQEQEIATVLQAVQVELKRNNFSTNFIIFTAITIDEILSNIMHYAFDDSKVHKITVDLTIVDKTMVLCFQDDGVSFNPVQHLATKIKEPVRRRSIGGLGIYIVQQIMDSITYKRINNKNVLAITKTEKENEVME